MRKPIKPLDMIVKEHAKGHAKLLKKNNKRFTNSLPGQRYTRSPILAAKDPNVRGAAAIILGKQKDLDGVIKTPKQTKALKSIITPMASRAKNSTKPSAQC